MDYNAECCQARGTYELNCKDSHGDGWHGAYIQIGEADEHLCRNFTHGHSLNLRVEHKAPGNLERSSDLSIPDGFLVCLHIHKVPTGQG